MIYLQTRTAWLRLFLPAVFFATLVGGATRAATISDVSGDINIIDAAAEPANRDASTTIHVQIENSSATAVTLRSVETKLGERGSFDVHAGSGSMLHQASFTLGSGEQARFDNKNFRLILGPLKRDLKEGDVVEVTFIFDSWSTVIPVHVHDVLP